MSEKGIHIVVVDDEEELANVLSEALEMEGFSVSEFHSADEALPKLDDISFNVIISDAHMPGMNGQQFFEEVKKKYSHHYLFYLCTGDIDVSDADFQAKGGTRVVSKPYNIFDLCDEITEKFS